MPLRAKVTNAAFHASATLEASSTQNPLVIKELPSDPPNDVLFSSLFGLRTITLNRPKKLNSLDGSMIRKIVPRLQEWTKSELASIIVIKGEGRAFCAGGDVAALAKQNNTPEGQAASTAYFADEYALDHYIATYEKPYVAFIDGITMGGGVGLSAHAPFRIATERTVFAMPETTIGLFPDVGASFFLPRLDGSLGMYLALTSEQLKGVNTYYAGIATHYLHSSSLNDLESRFSELQFRDSDNYQTRLERINATIEEFTTGLPRDQQISAPVSGDIREAIDLIFRSTNSLEQMMSALKAAADGNNSQQHVKDWAKSTIKTIEKRSPTSLRATIQLLRKGATADIAKTFNHELKLAANFMKHPDFVEGVTALLINKPKTEPKWQPADAKDVKPSDVDDMFKDSISFRSLREVDKSPYSEYPHAWTGLPSEQAVREYVTKQSPSSLEAIVEHFVKITHGKVGVKEKVHEMLARKARMGRSSVVWNNI